MPAAQSSTAAGYLEIRDLVVEYKVGDRALLVLDHIDLSAEPSEIVAVVGPSGCGKSTLAHVVAGFLRPSSGSVRIDGELITGPSPDRGIVLQDLGLFPWRTVRQNVQTGLESQGGLERTKRNQIVDALLTRVRLAAFEGFYPSHLSGGMAQRVALARALATKPKILLLDEPFGALDAQTRLEMQSLLLEMQLQDRVTVIVVTHDVEEAIFLADRVVLLSARPAHILRQFRIKIPRPRSYVTLTSNALVSAKGEILGALRGEILHASTQAYIAASRSDSRTLRVGFVPAADAVPLLSAVRLLQKDQGVAAVEAFSHESGPALVSGVAAGNLDFALVGACPILIAIHQRIATAIVRDGGYLTRSKHFAGLVVLSHLAALSDDELANRPIGINGFGTNAEFLCRRLFAHSAKELRFRVMPSDQMVGELRAGELEVAVLFPPHSQQALASPGIVARSNFLDQDSPLQSSLLVMAESGNGEPAYARLFLQHWDAMIRHLLAGGAEAEETAQARIQLGLTPEDLLPSWDPEVSLDRLKELDSVICLAETAWQPIEEAEFPVRH
jgi:NitT/TauT family transport system ATP-binding protein